MTEEKKNKGGRPRKEPDAKRAEFRFQAAIADIEFVDAAAKRLGIERGALIRMAVEAYVDPLARLQDAAKASDQMRRDMREMRSLVGKILDMVSRIGLFISGLYAAENSAEQEAQAESVRDFFLSMEDDYLPSASSTPYEAVGGYVMPEGEDAMGYEG